MTANEGSPTGTIISINPPLTSTITLEDFASLVINKSVSTDEISPGETFSYTIALENSGNLDANGVVVTDVLPVGFDISNITVTVGSGPEITVPAATNTETGLTVITVTGSIN